MLFLLVPGATLTLLNHLDEPSVDAEPYRVKSAEYALSPSQTPPRQVQWQAVEVPNQIPARMSPFVSAWYRVALTVPDGERTLALYVTSPSANVAPFLDDIALGPGTTDTLPLTFTTEPLFYPFDPRLLSADQPRYLYLHLTRRSATAGIAPFYIGPADVLHQHFLNERFFSEQVPGALVVLMATLSLLTLTLFVLRPQQTAYGWYGLAMGLWALHTGHGLINDIPIAHFLWFSLVYLTLWWVPVFAVFTNRFFDLPWHRAEPTLWISGGILTIAGVAVGIHGDEAPYVAFFSLFWIPWVVIWALFVVAQLVFASFRRPDVESLGMLLTAITSISVGIRDTLVELDLSGASGDSYYTQYTAGFSALMVMFLLARRFMRYDRDYAHLGQQLADERARITRDMHDGLGGQLMRALSLTQSRGNEREVQEALSTALQDLRLIIDSLTPTDPTVVAVLAGFRQRTGQWLRQQGIETVWQVGEVDDHALDAQQALHLLRILQELVTNVVRHAGARRLTLRVNRIADRLLIDVEDDGVGLHGTTPGRGLRNIQERARRMGATVEVAPSEAGTLARISLH